MASKSFFGGEMKFRQRAAWLSLVTYLALSFYAVYYIFDASEVFNRLAAEHRQRYHSGNPAPVDGDDRWWLRRACDHITDVPLPLLALLVLLPYLQMFGLLLACTRPDPRASLAVHWPVAVVNWCALRRPVRSSKVAAAVLEEGHFGTPSIHDDSERGEVGLHAKGSGAKSSLHQPLLAGNV